MGANVFSDTFTRDLGRCVQQLRQQTEDQRAQQGWPGPEPQRPLLVSPLAIAQYGLTYEEFLGGPDLTVSILTGASDTFDVQSGAVGGGSDVAIFRPGLYFGFAGMIAAGLVDLAYTGGGEVLHEVIISLNAAVALGSTSVNEFCGTASGHCHRRVTGITASDPQGGMINLPNFGTNGIPGQIILAGTFRVPDASRSSPTTLHFTGSNLTGGSGGAIFLRIGPAPA